MAWLPHTEGLARLQTCGRPSMRQPLLAYLRGDAPAGALWQYREQAGAQALVGRAPGADPSRNLRAL